MVFDACVRGVLSLVPKAPHDMAFADNQHTSSQHLAYNS